MANDLALICDACKEPIGDGAGYLWIDNDAVAAEESAAAGRRPRDIKDDDSAESVRSYLAAGLFELPQPVRWQAHHAACDLTPEAGSYPIPAVDIRTWAELVEWTAQLMEKPWLAHTDWSYVLRGVANGDTRLIAVS
ncbi:hypothetical protein [Actinacidiphila oryziradicis]|jgi:hypothetical protein|uniref:Uncharacterized protein n=1 Tax=Actinacidiphila oryziradicis TaxID=2571141 RepID=A0A4U0SRK3_9ACTN|nr:hypothetical protein [Actinacidiphila oryziradicis]MCW2871343.1 hypothetical protein [Actinacidiphila oryziradicis]TKA10767.1 hypothetical protein FCI23_15860 [Actinacidiphila oryziradicis]